MAAPTKLVPVMKIPQAAPKTESTKADVIPKEENIYGDGTHSVVVDILDFFANTELFFAKHSSTDLFPSFGIYICDT